MARTFKNNPIEKMHHGNNIKRIRLLLGIQQSEVSVAFGGAWTQKKVSRIESLPHVTLQVRKDLAALFDVDIDLFDKFNEAACRLTLNHMMRFNKIIAPDSIKGDQLLLEDIVILLENALSSLHRERQNMQLLLRLLQQMKVRSISWAKDAGAASAGEVRESQAFYRRVA